MKSLYALCCIFLISQLPLYADNLNNTFEITLPNTQEQSHCPSFSSNISISTKIGSVSNNPLFSFINIVRSIKSWRKNKKETKQFLQKYRNWN